MADYLRGLLSPFQTPAQFMLASLSPSSLLLLSNQKFFVPPLRMQLSMQSPAALPFPV